MGVGVRCDNVRVCNLWNPTSPKCCKGEDLICGLNIQNINNAFSLTFFLGKFSIIGNSVI